MIPVGHRHHTGRMEIITRVNKTINKHVDIVTLDQIMYGIEERWKLNTVLLKTRDALLRYED